MTVPTFPRRWGEVLTLASILLVLTATLVTGSGNVQCGPNSLCGYGTRCHNVSQCVCLPGNTNLTEKEDEGVRECGDQLCGYRAQCNTDMGECGCSFSNGVLLELKDTFPSLLYCVVVCNEGSSSCPDNTTCTESPGDSSYRCYCSAGATLSSTGQCLEHDSNPLVIGLTVGIGGAVLLAVVVVLVAAFALKHRRLKSGVNGVLENELSEFNHSYENAVSLSSPGMNIPSSRAVPTVDGPSLGDPANNSPYTYVNVSAPSQSRYDNATRGLYQSANTPDTSESRLYTTLRQT